MKVAINRCFGGFSISDEGYERLTGEPSNQFKGLANMHSLPRNMERHDPKLIALIEEMGPKFSGRCGEIVVVEIPDGVDYEIDEYDGLESIHETHRSWS